MAKSPKEYSKLLKGELLELARKAGLSDLGALTKDEIVARLTRAGRKLEEKLTGRGGEPKPLAPASKIVEEGSSKATRPAVRKTAGGKPAKDVASPAPKSTSRRKAGPEEEGPATDADTTRTAMATTTGTFSATTTTETESASASG